jgi:soluble lytic murein transglycosylase-like protein
MATESEILKEFLIAIGFKIDEAGGKKFRSQLSETTKGAMALGGTMIGVGLAVEKFVESMADGLSRLFYISERTGATVAGLKATEAAFQGVGLQAGVATEAIEAIGDMLRKPGTESLLRGWGINTKQPTEFVAKDVEHMLAAMYNRGGGERYTALQLAQDWLHMNERNFVQLVKELPVLDQQFKKSQDIMKLSGQNYQTAASQGAEFNRQLGIIGQEISGLGAKWLGLNSYMNDAVDTATKASSVLDHMLRGDWKNMFENAFPTMKLKPEDEARLRAAGGVGKPKFSNISTQDLQIEAQKDAMKFGLDPNIFMRMLKQESAWNPTAESPAGAKGVAQFMPATARGRGFEAGQDPMRDIFEAAKFLKELLDKYKGNYRLALQAYNAGSGRIDDQLAGGKKYGPLTKETTEYPNKILGNTRLGDVNAQVRGEGSKVFAPQVTQNFNISGSDAGAVGEVVQSKVRRTNADLFRDGVGLFAN